jgi:hypothetical protein
LGECCASRLCRYTHLFFVAIGVPLLTPVPTPVATLYVMLIPSWLVFIAKGSGRHSFDSRDSASDLRTRPAARGPLLTTSDTTHANSCHNTLRGGRGRISAQVRMYLSVRDDEWRKLTAVFRTFVADYGLAFRDFSESRPGVGAKFFLSVCDAVVTMSTSEQRCASRGREFGVVVCTSVCTKSRRALSGRRWQGR